MDGERFDRNGKALGTGVGRRPALREALGVALGIAGARQVVAACLATSEPCTSGDQCCPGRRKRKQGTSKRCCRQAHGQSAWTFEQNACATGAFSCNGTQINACVCWVTTGGASFYGRGAADLSCTGCDRER